MVSKETQQTSRSFQNWNEAEKVVEVIMDLQRKSNGLAGTHQISGNDPWFSIHRVRVITFYQAQVELISYLLRTNGVNQIGVSTVDSSQGSEADLIVVSFVRTGELNRVGFLSDIRRLNVALTRAKYKLICIGNSKSLSQTQGSETATIRRLVQNARDQGAITTTYQPNRRTSVRPSRSYPSNSFNHNGSRPFKRRRTGR